jgi:hypothetical protein
LSRLRRQSELTEDEVMAVVVPRDATTLERVELAHFCEGLLPNSRRRATSIW